MDGTLLNSRPCSKSPGLPSGLPLLFTGQQSICKARTCTELSRPLWTCTGTGSVVKHGSHVKNSKSASAYGAHTNKSMQIIHRCESGKQHATLLYYCIPGTTNPFTIHRFHTNPIWFMEQGPDFLDFLLCEPALFSFK